MSGSIKSAVRRTATLCAVLASAAAMIVSVSGPAAAAGEWNNHQTTIISRDHGLYIGTLEVAVWTTNIPASYHTRVWGPGFSVNTKSEYVGAFRTYRDWVPLNRVFPAGSRICAEGWRYNGHGGYDSIGLPCFTVTQ